MKTIMQVAILAISVSASAASFAEEEADTAPVPAPAYDSPAKRTFETLKEAAAQLTDKVKGVEQKTQDDLDKIDPSK